MKRQSAFYCILTLLFLFSSSFCQASIFPYRDSYPEIKIIELGELKAGLDKGAFLVIDVRTPTEFNAIHIKRAINLPYTTAKFSEQLKALSRENPGKEFAVYCNGITCIKSYKAAEDALYAGIEKVYAFDAGIRAWANTYPDQTLLNGEEMESKDRLSNADRQFFNCCLSYDQFKSLSGNENTVIIDARDPMQRTKPLPGMEKALKIPLDKLVDNIISKGHMKDKALFIFDQVGKQVNWLMFYLEKNGYTNYHFLAGGATAVLKVQEYR